MQLNRLLEALDDATLSELFANATLNKGRAYVGRVRQIEAVGNQLEAWVQGSEREPYRARVKLVMREYDGERTLEITSRCSCPVGSRCKHVVALLLAARRPGALNDKPREAVLSWVRKLKTRLQPASTKPAKPKNRPTHAIFYAFDPHSWQSRSRLHLYKIRLGRDGEPTADAERWYNIDQALMKPPSFVAEEDLPLLRSIRNEARKEGGYWGGIPLEGDGGFRLVQAILASEKAMLLSDDDDDAPLQALRAGAARAGQLHWLPDRDGLRARIAVTTEASFTLSTEPFHYIDSGTGEIGILDLPDAPACLALLELPALNPKEIPVVAAALAEVAPDLPAPDAEGATALPWIDAGLQPVLTLDTLSDLSLRNHRGYQAAPHASYDYAIPRFRYGVIDFATSDDASIVTLADGSAARVRRQPEAEGRALQALRGAGFQAVHSRHIYTWSPLPEDMLGLESLVAWQNFTTEIAPQLQAAGWKFEPSARFRHFALQAEAWFAELEENQSGWFELSLGIEVEGERIDLAPLLYALFRRDARWLDRNQLQSISDDEHVDLLAEGGKRIRVPAGRIKPLATTLVDLFDAPSSGPLRVSRQDAPRLSEALDQEKWALEGEALLNAWLEKIRNAQTVEPVAAPEGLLLTLRTYQLEGLAWLQHLRKTELGGILADDMGLGKTAQTLAHLLLEKQAGRLDRPVLIVLPTSLIFNWASEVQRFAPTLSVLKLQGKARSEAFAQIPNHDLCLTTYPLLWRDREQLAAHSYHYVILDEAQTVKNAASQAAKVVRELDTRHRLCITGTPLENHLGELWSQFDFLLPGFLGDAKDFNARWRNPIEKQGNLLRREVLSRRIAPFILRRRKEDVAKELPPKTIVVRSVSLEGRQRDLYETVRASMDKRVRDEIASRGFARSQILILDALLKLRQVCCDPRLLKSEAASKVKEGAKLDLLMQMLPELIDEGRRILVFSQFTGMLALIGAELMKRDIDFALLTGDTDDREQQIKRFQKGNVPVFLISLKAGGVGLNLTTADTVIHYDPWWNPAAENQASDRAHRIGQSKNVFVYKLVVAGSIEERILGLQERKADLAASILGESTESTAKFDEKDIQALLAPLPD